MKIIVHAGFPKTGSTSIQRALAGARASLAEQGILYPRLSLRPHVQHWPLVAACSQSPAHHPMAHKLMPNIEEKTKSLLQEFDGLVQTVPDDGIVILSAEGFGHALRGGGVRKLRNLLNKYSNDVHVVMYARHPISRYTSSVQQRLKSQLIPSVPSQINPSIGSKSLFYVKIFGREKCVFRVFDRSLLHDSSVVQDFSKIVETISGKTITLREVAANESISGWACCVLWEEGLGIKSKPGFREFLKRLIEFNRHHQGPKLQLPADWVPHIEEVQKEDWNAFLQLADVPDERKAELKIGPVETFGLLGEEHMAAWFQSYRNPEFAEEFRKIAKKHKLQAAG